MSELYETHELVGLLEVQKPFIPFFKDYFFSTTILSDKQYISLDEVVEDETIAAFVSPMVAGVPDTKKGGIIKSFKPAYVKPTDSVEPTDMLTRQPGEQINGDLTPEDRWDDAVAKNLTKQDKKIGKREEVMCVELLVSGKVIVVGDDYPEQEVNYMRDAALDITLAGTDKWDNAASSPSDTIEDVAMIVLEKSGAAVTDIIFTPTVWRKLRKNKEFVDQLDVRRGVSEMPSITPKKPAKVQYKGRWGDYDLWVYSNSYKDKDGNVITPFSGNKMLMVARGDDGLGGRMAYGAIMDKRAGLKAMARFPKMWDVEDPSSTVVQTQSAPLPLPININATAIVEVY